MIKNYSKVLEFTRWEYSETKPRRVPKKKEKLRVLIVKSIFLRIIIPAFLALGLVQNGYQSDVRQSR